MQQDEHGSRGNAHQQPGSSGKIQHTKPGFGHGSIEPPTSMPLESSPTTSAGPPQEDRKITAFADQARRHEDNWDRTPNTTGTGAIHVKTFHCAVSENALAYMDQVINEWLDAHPQYEVKFVNSNIGLFSGKIKEPHLICQIWV